MEKVWSELRQVLLVRWMRYWLPVVGYAALIFYLSSLLHPEERLPNFLFEKLSDKFLHVVEYAVLGMLCYRAFRWSAGPIGAQQAMLLAIVAGSFYGMTDEVHQAFVPLRESSWTDWLADMVGVAVGAFGARHLMHGNDTSDE